MCHCSLDGQSEGGDLGDYGGCWSRYDCWSDGNYSIVLSFLPSCDIEINHNQSPFRPTRLPEILSGGHWPVTPSHTVVLRICKYLNIMIMIISYYIIISQVIHRTVLTHIALIGLLSDLSHSYNVFLCLKFFDNNERRRHPTNQTALLSIV